MRKETKSKIYKVTVRPIIKHTLDKRAKTYMLKENEIKLLRKIIGKEMKIR